MDNEKEKIQLYQIFSVNISIKFHTHLSLILAFFIFLYGT